MSKAFLMLEADRIEHGLPEVRHGRVEQETRLYEGERCICVLKVTYSAGSPAYDAALRQWEEANHQNAPAGLASINHQSVASDAQLP